MWPSLETTPKTITVAGNFVFITLVTLNRLDFNFEGAGNGPVVKTWIGKEHDLYSGASPISLVKHCVTFRHDRRLLSLLGFVHNWPTSRWSATKKEKWFSLNGNGIMSSFLGRQFYRSTLSLSLSLSIYIYIYIYYGEVKQECIVEVKNNVSIFFNKQNKNDVDFFSSNVSVRRTQKSKMQSWRP